MKKNIKKKTNKEINYEGLVSLGELRNDQRIADVVSIEDVEVENFTGCCKVQIMRDGHIYITQLPKRFRNKALFRDDNCTFTIGRNHMVYFSFWMPEALLNEVPQQLVQQASTIAQKVLKELILKQKEA